MMVSRLTLWDPTPLASKLSAAIKSLAGVQSRVAKEASREIKKQIEKDFAKGQSPYGTAWAPLAPATLAKGRTPPPLTDTGKGLKGILVNPMRGAGISVVSTVGYMGVHQKGTPDIPARKFMPEGTLPPSWRRAIKRAADKVLKNAN